MFIFFITTIFSWIMFNIFSAKREGEQPKIGFNVLIPMQNGDCFHLHHWLSFTILLVAIILVYWLKGYSFKSIYFQAFSGFLVGGIIEDFKYSDKFEFIQKC